MTDAIAKIKASNFALQRAGARDARPPAAERERWPASDERDATPSVLHQRHIGRMLRTIDAARKYVVSSTLERVDWNAELVRGDLGKEVQALKQESGKEVFVGGVKLPLALTELGLIDEYEFVVQPGLAGHGPTCGTRAR